MSVGRKVFYCVVDDTCLTTNLGEIKKWTSQDAIVLIVPLYTLERLHVLKKTGSQSGINAREAVRFLDRVTSGKHNISAEKVILQGPMEQFATWGDAEKFVLPEFKEEAQNTPANGSQPANSVAKEEAKQPVEDIQPEASDPRDLNDMSQMLLSKLNFKKEKEPGSTSAASAGTCSVPPSPTSGGSRASPECSSRQLEEDVDTAEADASNVEDADSGVKYVAPAVPYVLKPLLNAVLWRLHALPAAPSPQSSCILVSNDRETQAWAQKFGIIVKNVAQLRTSIIYEDKEFKNHCKYLEKNQNQNQSQVPAEPKPLLSYEDESDEDVLVFVPRKQGKAGQQTPAGRTPTKNTPGRGNRVISGNTNGGGRPRAPSAAAETPLEVPSTPIDPDSFNRSIGMTKKNVSPNANSSPTPANRGSPNQNPRPVGNRRGGPRGAFRGAARGRGKLWVP